MIKLSNKILLTIIFILVSIIVFSHMSGLSLVEASITLAIGFIVVMVVIRKFRRKRRE